jgi:hypothetical protein
LDLPILRERASFKAQSATYSTEASWALQASDKQRWQSVSHLQQDHAQDAH